MYRNHLLAIRHPDQRGAANSDQVAPLDLIHERINDDLWRIGTWAASRDTCHSTRSLLNLLFALLWRLEFMTDCQAGRQASELIGLMLAVGFEGIEADLRSLFVYVHLRKAMLNPVSEKTPTRH